MHQQPAKSKEMPHPVTSGVVDGDRIFLWCCICFRFIIFLIMFLNKIQKRINHEAFVKNHKKSESYKLRLIKS